MKTLQITLLLTASLCTLGCQSAPFRSFRAAQRSQKEIAQEQLAELTKDAPQSETNFERELPYSKSRSKIQQASAEFEIPSSTTSAPTTSLASAATSDISTLLKEGQTYETDGNLAQAIAVYQQILVAHPSNDRAHHRLAVIADIQKRFMDAEQHYRSALQQSPLDPDLLSDIGYSYLLQNRFQESQNYLNQAAQIAPTHKRALNNLGLLLAKQGQREQALAMFRKTGTEAEAQQKISSITPANNFAPNNITPNNNGPTQLANVPPAVINPSAETTVNPFAANAASVAPAPNIAQQQNPFVSQQPQTQTAPVGTQAQAVQFNNNNQVGQLPNQQMNTLQTTPAQQNQMINNEVTMLPSPQSQNQLAPLPTVGMNQNTANSPVNNFTAGTGSFTQTQVAPIVSNNIQPNNNATLPNGARNPFAFEQPVAATNERPNNLATTPEPAPANNIATWPPTGMEQAATVPNNITPTTGSVSAAPQAIQPALFNQPNGQTQYQPTPQPTMNSLPSISPQPGSRQPMQQQPQPNNWPATNIPAQQMPAGMQSVSPWGASNPQSLNQPQQIQMQNQPNTFGQPVQQTVFNASGIQQINHAQQQQLPTNQQQMQGFPAGVQNRVINANHQMQPAQTQPIMNANGTVTTPFPSISPAVNY